ncbi:MAG: DNA methyltransferase [Proteobacteria bacterium]|nr:DNA methyltransferase [Pseudomonadota bacterium]
MSNTSRQPEHSSPKETRIRDQRWNAFPQTRYLGSKRKLLGLLEGVFSRIEFDTVLDPFSGTGAVSYLLKTMGKKVTSSDIMKSSTVCARALVENSSVTLENDIDKLLAGLPQQEAPSGFIEKTFAGIFFETDENRFLDGILPRIGALPKVKKELALYALFQACLSKRPYNLFHRANLSMRQRKVHRTFGNKTTWERPFDMLIRRYATEAGGAVFDSGRTCRALCADALTLDPTPYDLVYFDTPYVSSKGTGVDYLDYYHFMEGLASPDDWAERIMHRYKHKPLTGKGQNPWCDSKRIQTVFESTIKHFSDSVIVLSYRSDGIPSIDTIFSYLVKAGKQVEILDSGPYTYVLSRNRRSKEVILVGQ